MLVADPDIVQEMLVTKNAQIDKTGVYAAVFANFFGKSFLFSKTDGAWKAKRKGLGQAFYKDKLITMLNTLKDYMFEQNMAWMNEIKASAHGTTKIDISRVILHTI